MGRLLWVCLAVWGGCARGEGRIGGTARFGGLTRVIAESAGEGVMPRVFAGNFFGGLEKWWVERGNGMGVDGEDHAEVVRGAEGLTLVRQAEHG
jgi:hypothetical protein